MQQALQSMWAKADIKVSKISQLAPAAAHRQTFTSGNWQVDVGFLRARPTRRSAWGCPSSSAARGPDSGVADPSLDALINKAATEMDQTQRAADYKSVYAKLWAQHLR